MDSTEPTALGSRMSSLNHSTVGWGTPVAKQVRFTEDPSGRYDCFGGSVMLGSDPLIAAVC